MKAHIVNVHNGEDYSILLKLVNVIFPFLAIVRIPLSVAYYLGLGQNLWVLTLIPFVLLIKFGPNFEKIALIDESILI